MRLIDADALKTCINCECKPFVKVNEILEIIDNFYTLIGNWTSVKDRLPGYGENVLVYIERDAWGDGNEPHRKKEIAIGYHVNGHWYVDGCNNVTGLYWMSLPKEPK